MDKRQFTRVQYQTRAILKGKSTSVEGQVENLSLNGLFLKTQQTLEQGEKLAVVIFLSGVSSELSFELKGAVVRQQEASIAVQFEMKGIDIDSLTHLRYIVSYNQGDWDAVMKEYLDFLERQQEERSAR